MVGLAQALRLLAAIYSRGYAQGGTPARQFLRPWCSWPSGMAGRCQALPVSQKLTRRPALKIQGGARPPDQLRKFPPHTGSGCPDHKSEPISTPLTSPRTSPTLASGSAEQGVVIPEQARWILRVEIGEEPVPAILPLGRPFPHLLIEAFGMLVLVRHGVVSSPTLFKAVTPEKI
jgi:hypothetical protein